MSTNSSPSTPNHQRLRIRFRKEANLRWISHRDLVRTVERLCRRAELDLRMSEGFHPKPRMSFPSALALGIEGLSEVLELELTGPVEPQELKQRLNADAPAGLVITHVEALAPGQRKGRARSMRYQFPVPDERHEQVRQSVEAMMAASSLLVERDGRPEGVDILANLTSLELHDGNICFCLRATDQASTRPRDVLQALGLADLEQQGQFLTRSEVEVVS